MSAKRFFVTALAIVTLLAASAVGQKNEVSGLIGRTFISDQGVPGTNFFDNVIHFGNATSFEANFARQLWSSDFARLSAEFPLVFDLDEDLNFGQNVIPQGYNAFFLTPAARLNLFPNTLVSPWVSFGGGWAHFGENSILLFGGKNPGKTGTNTGALQGGVGLDVRLWRQLSARVGARDFWSGLPNLNVNTGKSHQHNIFVGGGLVWQF